MEAFDDWSNSTLQHFPPRLLHAVHSVEMIITWLVLFQTSTKPSSIWSFNFVPVFLMKYSLFLINNFFLPTRMSLAMEPFSDFLLLLTLLFWSKNSWMTRRLIACLKPESVDSRLKLFLRVTFYFLLAVFRTWSVYDAVDRYGTDAVSLWISCMILFEFTSFITFLKTKNSRKFLASLSPSVVVATVVAQQPNFRAIVVVYFFHRQVVSVLFRTKIIPKSIPDEARARQPHRNRPKKITKTT